MFRFGTIGWDPYDTTRNTTLEFKVNLNARSGGNSFASSGTIKITVTKGGSNFTKLSSVDSVQVTLSSGTIKKYTNPDDPPEDNLTEFTNGITEPLSEGTKLYVQATGEISTPSIDGSEVTIKATVEVTTEGNLNAGLNLRGSNGLGGSITPTGASTTVKISGSGSTINLTLKSLAALQSLTKNAVTLTASGTSKFRSSASITVTRTSSTADFKALTLNVSQNLQISISEGTIKNSDGTDLQTGDLLSVGTQLVLDASGEITKPPTNNASVKLTGTIVVTAGGTLGSELNFGGGPDRSGVSGSLKLYNETGTSNVKTNGSLTINKAAYDRLYKTQTHIKIGAITFIAITFFSDASNKNGITLI